MDPRKIPTYQNNSTHIQYFAKNELIGVARVFILRESHFLLFLSLEISEISKSPYFNMFSYKNNWEEPTIWTHAEIKRMHQKVNRFSKIG